MNNLEFTEFRKQVKNILTHLLDTSYLESHLQNPHHFSPLLMNHSSTRALQIRSIIKECIEELKPSLDRPEKFPIYRVYQSLSYRYVYGMRLTEIEHELGISQRQLQRELKKGLDGLTTILWNRIQSFKNVEQSISEESISGQLTGFLSGWEGNRQPLFLSELFDRVFETLRPFAGQKLGFIQDLFGKLEVFPVYVDPTLTHVALVKVFKIVLQASGNENPEIKIEPQSASFTISIQIKSTNQEEYAEEWQEISILLTQQDIVFSRVLLDHTGLIKIVFPRVVNKRILIVDDNEGIQRLLLRYLSGSSYAVTAITDGTKALESIRAEKPDAIILDLMIPVVDGWEILRSLMTDPHLSDIPVIICSVLTDEEFAYSQGARGFIKKPIDRTKLISILENVLSPLSTANVID